MTRWLGHAWQYVRVAFGMEPANRTLLWVDQDTQRWVEYRLLDDGMFELVAVGELPLPRRWKGVVG